MGVVQFRGYRVGFSGVKGGLEGVSARFGILDVGVFRASRFMSFNGPDGLGLPKVLGV